MKLSEKASVRFSIALRTSTRKGKKTIIRSVPKGALQHSFKAGSQTLAFSGWIGHKALAPGTYLVAILATDAAKNHSKTTKLTLTIVAKPSAA